MGIRKEEEKERERERHRRKILCWFGGEVRRDFGLYIGLIRLRDTLD